MPTSKRPRKLPTPMYPRDFFSCGSLSAGGRNGNGSRGANSASRFGGKYWVIVLGGEPLCAREAPRLRSHLNYSRLLLVGYAIWGCRRVNLVSFWIKMLNNLKNYLLHAMLLCERNVMCCVAEEGRRLRCLWGLRVYCSVSVGVCLVDRRHLEFRNSLLNSQHFVVGIWHVSNGVLSFAASACEWRKFLATVGFIKLYI